jgi:hypothetical protein
MKILGSERRVKLRSVRSSKSPFFTEGRAPSSLCVEGFLVEVGVRMGEEEEEALELRLRRAEAGESADPDLPLERRYLACARKAASAARTSSSVGGLEALRRWSVTAAERAEKDLIPEA